MASPLMGPTVHPHPPRAMTLLPPISKVNAKTTKRMVGRQSQPFFLMIIVSLLLVGGIGSRLAYIQLIQGQIFREKADSNRIRTSPEPPIRGNMFDRHGEILATTQLSYSAFVLPLIQTQPQWPEKRQLLAQILQMSEGEINEILTATSPDSPKFIRLARNLSESQIVALEELSNHLEGLELIIDPMRAYPFKENGAHLLGYTGELNETELEKRRDQGYRLGDVVGKLGLEAALESNLRGDWGGQKIEVNGAGQVMRILGKDPAIAGEDLTLTLDIQLQRAAEKILGYREGAIVVLEAHSGEVLAMASYPRFDPNIFSDEISDEEWNRVQAQGDPFVNRAIRAFPPASTFKVVTAVAGMETGKYPPNVVLHTTAYLPAAGVRFYEWNKAGFGSIGYRTALAWSSNTFFGQVGRGIGGETLIDWSRRFGFGRKTGIELQEEVSGLIADDAWKREHYGNPWSVGDTINMSIGQGLTSTTPLQVAVMFAAIANNGYLVQPHLVKSGGRSLDSYRTSLNLKQSTIDTVQGGLRAVVAGGTGKVLNSGSLPPSAGKSGTAETSKQNHTWFGGYVPYDNPEIVVVAFAEHSGGGGGSVAGPMVRQTMEAYFRLKQERREKEQPTDSEAEANPN